jgi:peptidoglycan hydrolase-like protein with peptidoglycan-binding domain
MSKSAPAQQQSNNGQQSNQASRDEIKQAQQALDEKGFKVNADGVLGSQTKQALSKFQQQQGLQQTGQLDQETLSALGISQAGSTTGQGGSSYGNNNNNASGQKNLQQPSSGMQK